MSYNIVLQTEALSEIQDAFDWYEEQKDGLGYELLEEIELCFQKLTEHPSRYSYINPLYRRIKTNRFPYILVLKLKMKASLLTAYAILNENR